MQAIYNRWWRYPLFILNFALHSIAFSVRNKVTFNIMLAFLDAKRLDIRRQQNNCLNKK